MILIHRNQTTKMLYYASIPKHVIRLLQLNGMKIINVSERFLNSSIFFYWSDKYVFPPQPHTVGWDVQKVCFWINQLNFCRHTTLFITLTSINRMLMWETVKARTSRNFTFCCILKFRFGKIWIMQRCVTNGRPIPLIWIKITNFKAAGLQCWREVELYIFAFSLICYMLNGSFYQLCHNKYHNC